MFQHFNKIDSTLFKTKINIPGGVFFLSSPPITVGRWRASGAPARAVGPAAHVGRAAPKHDGGAGSGIAVSWVGAVRAGCQGREGGGGGYASWATACGGGRRQADEASTHTGETTAVAWGTVVQGFSNGQ